MKIEPPTNNELDLIKQNQVLISAIQMNIQSANFFNKINKKKISAFGFEFIKDIQGNCLLYEV